MLNKHILAWISPTSLKLFLCLIHIYDRHNFCCAVNVRYFSNDGVIKLSVFDSGTGKRAEIEIRAESGTESKKKNRQNILVDQVNQVVS